MSTNAGIAVKSGDKYNTIYCHWDGMPRTMYPILRDGYFTLERALALISFGDASSIDMRLSPRVPDSHDFSHPEDGVCVFYHRDRGDSWDDCKPAAFTRSELIESWTGFEFVYIFEDGEWTVYQKGAPVRVNPAWVRY